MKSNGLLNVRPENYIQPQTPSEQMEFTRGKCTAEQIVNVCFISPNISGDEDVLKY